MNARIYCKKKKKGKIRRQIIVTRDEEEKQTEDRAIFTDTLYLRFSSIILLYIQLLVQLELEEKKRKKNKKI